VPVIVLCGLMLGLIGAICSLLRGLNKHSLSLIISVSGIILFIIGTAILNLFEHYTDQTFFMLLISLSISALIGIISLSSKKILSI
jgi:hypothetical protein